MTIRVPVLSDVRRLSAAGVPRPVMAVLAVDASLVGLYLLSRLLADLVGTDTVFWNFDLDREGTLPTWWASGKLLLAAAGVGLYALDTPAGGGRAWPWLVAAGLAVMSFDEGHRLHERAGDWGIGSGAALVLAGALVLAVAVAVRLAWRDVRAAGHALPLLAGGIGLFLAGAVGVDQFDPLFPGDGWARRAYVLSEELCEMLGVTAILWGVLELYRHKHPTNK